MLTLAESKSGGPWGPVFTGAINNNKWNVPTVLRLRLHWAYIFCGCRFESRPVSAQAVCGSAAWAPGRDVVLTLLVCAFEISCCSASCCCRAGTLLYYLPVAFESSFVDPSINHTPPHSPTLWNVGRSLIITISRLHAHWELTGRLCACLSAGLWAGPWFWLCLWLCLWFWDWIWVWPWATSLGNGVRLGGVGGQTVSGTAGQRAARVVWATAQQNTKRKETTAKKYEA